MKFVFSLDTDEKLDLRLSNKKSSRVRKKRVAKEKSAASDSSDDDGFSSSNLPSRRSRSKSGDGEKKGRGRPRKILSTNNNLIVTTPPLPVIAPSMPTSIKTKTPKKETAKKITATRRMSRQNSNVKSVEMLDTTDSSSDDDDDDSRSNKESGCDRNSKSKRSVHQQSPRNVPSKLVEYNSNSNSNSVSSPNSRDGLSSSNSNMRQSVSPHPTRIPSPSPRGQLSQSSSNENTDDSESDGRVKDDKKIRDKAKSDKNKSDTLRKLFSHGLKGDGQGAKGAKGKGQVVIVDNSEESQVQAKAEAIPIIVDKILSPRLAVTPTTSQNEQSQIVQPSVVTPLIRSPMKPQSRPQSRNNCSDNNTTTLPNNNFNHNKNSSFTPPSIICRIELSRLIRIPLPPHPNKSNFIETTSTTTATATLIAPPVIKSPRRRNSIQEEDRLMKSPALWNNRLSNSKENLNRLSNSVGGGGSDLHTNNNNIRCSSNPNESNIEIHRLSSNYFYNNNNSMDSRIGNNNMETDGVGGRTRDYNNYMHSPKSIVDETSNYKNLTKSSEKIKRESIKSEFKNSDFITSPKSTGVDDKNNIYTNSSSKLNNFNFNIKKENSIKSETSDNDVKLSNTQNNSKMGADYIPSSRRKRTSSSSSSSYKEKKRKKGSQVRFFSLFFYKDDLKDR